MKPDSTLDHIVKKFGLTIHPKHPTEIRPINRTIMAKTLGELGFKVGAEIGVAQGWHAEILCRENPQLKLYAVDIWERYPGYDEYTDRITQYYHEAKKRLALYNCVFIKKFSQDAAHEFEDGSLDFVYIDGAHDFKNVAIDLCEWSKKVRVGGIVYGHDYQRWRRGRNIVDVKDVVQAFVYANQIHPLFVIANGIRDPKFGGDVPGWMFVRQKTDPNMTISFIIPTIGRKSLARTVASIEKLPGDEVIVIQHTPPSGTWGNIERKEGIAKAIGDYLAFIDDDDYYVPGHRTIMEQAIAKHPNLPHLFRMRYPNGTVLWKTKDMIPGNIGSPMILVPNQKHMFYRFQFPGSTNMGDFYFVAKWKFPQTIWEEDIIAHLGHDDGVPGTKD